MLVLLAVLLLVALLPYIAKIPLAIAMQRAGGYDNHQPRSQQARLEGFGARALAAHQNSFEALQLFMAALLSCVLSGNTDILMQQLAVAFALSRVGYIACYLADWALLRSISWAIGCGMLVTILVRSICTVWS